MATQWLTCPVRHKKSASSSLGPSLVLVGLSLLCAGWLLGYGLAQSSEISTIFASRSMNGPHSSLALPSWRSEQRTKKSGYEP